MLNELVTSEVLHRVAALDQPMCQHGGALVLQFILVGGGVVVGADSHRREPWDEVDAVIPGSWWRHAGGLGEDRAELIQQGQKKVGVAACP